MSVIELTRITKRYDHEEQPAVRALSLAVASGEFVCLIGASGCGKTSVLKMIAGLEDSSEGALVKPAAVSMVFQSGALFPWLSVYDNVALGLRQQGKPESHVRPRVETELRTMHMLDFSTKYPRELSGGQRQRVGIARALAVDPAVLLLDEPFSALDPKTTAELHDDLINVWKERAMTVLMVSHLIEEAVSLAGRVVLMRDGAIDQTFTIDLPYPRHESEHFHHEVMRIRREFFK